MTTPTLEDQARCEAALRGWAYCYQCSHKHDPNGAHGFPTGSNITTAEGREAIRAVLGKAGWTVTSGVTVGGQGAATLTSPDGQVVIRTRSDEPAAFIAAWYEFVNRWKEQDETDLVAELRTTANRLDRRDGYPIDGPLLRRAADEIERLRQRAEKAEAALREIAAETYDEHNIQFAFGHVQRIATAALAQEGDE